MKKRIVIVILSFLIISALGAGACIIYLDNRDPGLTTTPEDLANAPGMPPTYTTETEGETIEVLDDVPLDSIKNYDLVAENERFKIRERDDAYTITLYAVVNRPDQYQHYQDQLRKYKGDALKYLENSGVNINEANITYEPEEAAYL